MASLEGDGPGAPPSSGLGMPGNDQGDGPVRPEIVEIVPAPTQNGEVPGDGGVSSETPPYYHQLPESQDDVSMTPLRPTESVRRRLSKQKEAVDETTTTLLPVPEVLTAVEDPYPDSSEREEVLPGMMPRSRQLVRGLALCGDDDTRLRPPPPATLQRHPHSLSRESSGTDYTDSGGIDLRTFVSVTLHKNPRDRQMILGLEKQLTDFVNDPERKVYKFATMSSYNRMLIHRVAVLFGLDHNVDTSGQSVVVNKTERTSLPDFEFASLIQGNSFTDPKRSMRTGHSHDEVRDPSLMGYSGSMTADWANRRTHSFETTQMVYNGGNWVSHHGARSFDVPPNGQQWTTDRTAILRKAGSFGGVPAYYRSGSGHLGDTLSDRPCNPAPAAMQHYSSHGSVSHMSPRTFVDELSDGVGGIQVDVRGHSQPITMHTNMVGSHTAVISPSREIIYGAASSPYQQQVCMQPTMVSPHQQPMYAPSYHPNQMGMSPNMHPNVQQTVISTPVQYQQVVYSQQWNNAPNYIPEHGMISHQVPVSEPLYTSRGAPMVGQRQVIYQQQPQQVQHQPPERHYFHVGGSPSTGMMASRPRQVHMGASRGSHSNFHPTTHQSSVDGGYGSMTQESLRDSEFVHQ